MTELARPPAPSAPRNAAARTTALGLVGLLCLAALLSVGLWGCNWLTGPRSRDQPKQGVILEVDRHKAALYINDQAITLLDSRKPNVIGLEPGTYRVEVRRAGYFSRYFDVKVTAKEFKRIKALLPPELD